MAVRASARYEGRIDAELSLSDLVILIRDVERGGDGSCLVFDMQKGIPPRNWMPAGSQMQRTNDGLIFTHPQRGERLEIFIEQIYFEQALVPELGSELLKLGAEREFTALIAQHLDKLGDNLALAGIEYRTSAGPVDLLCQQTDTGQAVAVEVKRRKIFPSAIWQMRRYLDALRHDPEFRQPPPRGIMVAPSIAKPAQELLRRDPDITFVRLSYQDLKALNQPKRKPDDV